jgi:hypothetical protein
MSLDPKTGRALPHALAQCAAHWSIIALPRKFQPPAFSLLQCAQQKRFYQGSWQNIQRRRNGLAPGRARAKRLINHVACAKVMVYTCLVAVTLR